jgi:hypothetical protein
VLLGSLSIGELFMGMVSQTLDDTEISSPNLPDNHPEKINLISPRSMYRGIFCIIAPIRILVFENFGIMASGRRRPEDGLR